MDRPFSLFARYLFPMDGKPLRDAWLVVNGGRIIDVGGQPVGQRRDLGAVAVLPAPINAHTHLEFSSIEKPLGGPSMRFTDWIGQVIRWRSERAVELPSGDWRIAGVRAGLDESRRAGVTTVGEIATLPWPDDFSHYGSIKGTVFLELLGLDPAGEDELLAKARDFITRVTTDGASFLPGISPHAPYTASPQLVERVSSLSREHRLSVAMHLAETREELELLASGSGPFRELLERVGAWYPEAIRAGTTPRDYLELLSEAHRALVIHGNYLATNEVEFLAEHRRHLSVVYCPRTHAYFGHDAYPLATMIDAGVNVALGTDSRASNPDLNLLHDLCVAADKHPTVSPQHLLELVTCNAAKALGVEADLGTLAPGKQADLAVIPIENRNVVDPYELLLTSLCLE